MKVRTNKINGFLIEIKERPNKRRQSMRYQCMNPANGAEPLLSFAVLPTRTLVWTGFIVRSADENSR